ncbi:MAG: hypothetical protein EDM05_000315 (plasmid) [Leptolyngbya sp. IPPAS B-1204]
MQPSEPAAIREDLGVMGLAGHLVPVPAVIREIERRRQLHAEMLQQVQALDEPFAQNLATLELKRSVYAFDYSPRHSLSRKLGSLVR